jgi:tRNA(fMet)-specific endonuclease VapC
MSGIALDTNAYVAFKRGHEPVLEILRLADDIIVPVIVLGELLAGFAHGMKEAENRAELAKFLDASRVRTLAVDDDTARWYAQVYAQLRRAGSPIPANDLWIAAQALQHGLPVLTFDRHFEAVEGLMVITTPEQLLP